MPHLIDLKGSAVWGLMWRNGNAKISEFEGREDISKGETGLTLRDTPKGELEMYVEFEKNYSYPLYIHPFNYLSHSGLTSILGQSSQSFSRE